MAIITYFGKERVVKCDGRCDKAWGVSGRPRKQLSDDPDDYVFLPDSELGIAPIDPGTYEGGHAKPENADYFPNKWCVRECERCIMSYPGDKVPFEYGTWNDPHCNMRDQRYSDFKEDQKIQP